MYNFKTRENIIIICACYDCILREDQEKSLKNFYKQSGFNKMNGYKITTQITITFIYTTKSNKIKWKYL